MLQIKVPDTELFDSERNLFIHTKETVLNLEHSLISISKWESFFHESFIDSIAKKKMKGDRFEYYVKCMTINQNVDPNVYSALTPENISSIAKYIDDPMTATTFKTDKQKVNKKVVVTSELIYYWMIMFNIPFECEKWHLNRLLTLIKVCEIKTQPAKKMSKSEIMARNHKLNLARRAATGSRG